MILSLEKIREITVGAVNVFEEDGMTVFRRFTDEESELYRTLRDEVWGHDVFKKKSYATTGVRLAFRTNSKKLSLTYKLADLPSRPFGFFDVYIDGTLADHIGTPNGVCEGKYSITLGEGENKVEIYFPWSKVMTVSDVTLDDGACVLPAKRSRRLMTYGDSITHGYDSQYPSLTYVSQLETLLDADVVNKAMGGDRFFPDILDADNGTDAPDIITVAYGTNDWASDTRAAAEKNCAEFYSRLSRKYPDAKIFAVSPIWREKSDVGTCNQFGEPCTVVDELIENAVSGLPNVIAINGWKLTPRLTEFYTDGLHPNDIGMGIYARNLYSEIIKYI